MRYSLTTLASFVKERASRIEGRGLLLDQGPLDGAKRRSVAARSCERRDSSRCRPLAGKLP